RPARDAVQVVRHVNNVAVVEQGVALCNVGGRVVLVPDGVPVSSVPDGGEPCGWPSLGIIIGSGLVVDVIGYPHVCYPAIGITRVLNVQSLARARDILAVMRKPPGIVI